MNLCETISLSIEECRSRMTDYSEIAGTLFERPSVSRHASSTDRQLVSSTDRQLVNSLANSSTDRQLVNSLAISSTDRQLQLILHTSSYFIPTSKYEHSIDHRTLSLSLISTSLALPIYYSSLSPLPNTSASARSLGCLIPE